MTQQQFTGVQILRFVAAMLVAFVHITQSISVYITQQGESHFWGSGGTGVDIFFVISGFVMAISTRGLPDRGRARVAAAWVFMKRRILRIVPLYWFYTLLKVAVLLAFPAFAMRSSVDPAHLTASLLFIPAVSPWGLIQPVLPVGWTLNFEMLFYVVFAIAIALGAFRIRFCLLVFLSIFLAGQTFPQSVPLAFYAQSIIFEFILGVCIAHLLTRHGPGPVGAAFLIIAAGAFLVFGIGGDHEVARIFTVGIGAAAIVLGTVWLERFVARAPGARQLSFLGDASYSIYLSHSFVVPAAVLALRSLGVHNVFVVAVTVAILVMVAGCMSYAWLERPMTSHLKRLFFRSPSPGYRHAATPLPADSMASLERARSPDGRYIYIACPWTPVGGGMFKVADYLIQSQALNAAAGAAQLRPLDTRGGGHAALSMWVLLTAVAKLVRGRLGGRLAGVHVNMAERLSLLRKSVIIVMCRTLGLPVVLHLHAAQLHHFYRALPGPLRSMTRWVFSLPATVVVLGASSRTFVTDELGVAQEKVEIVINGVPEPTQVRRQPEPGSVQRVLFLGNLSERKGVSDLLHALARPGFDSARLEVIVAGGGDRSQYQAKARALGVDGLVRFEGWCDQPTVARLLARSDLLVLPSYDEVLPLVILEAMANSVAVVCTPVGEIASVLTDGVNACFVTPGDTAGLAAALQSLLRQPALLEALGHNGRALYEQRFSLPRFFAGVARIHQRHFGVAAEPREIHSPAEEASS